ncbi:MAG: hypothetical protein ACRDTF_16680, partial [Pseudonocardiaceae bacterium]
IESPAAGRSEKSVRSFGCRVYLAGAVGTPASPIVPARTIILRTLMAVWSAIAPGSSFEMIVTALLAAKLPRAAWQLVGSRKEKS